MELCTKATFGRRVNGRHSLRQCRRRPASCRLPGPTRTSGRRWGNRVTENQHQLGRGFAQTVHPVDRSEGVEVHLLERNVVEGRIDQEHGVEVFGSLSIGSLLGMYVPAAVRKGSAVRTAVQADQRARRDRSPGSLSIHARAPRPMSRGTAGIAISC